MKGLYEKEKVKVCKAKSNAEFYFHLHTLDGLYIVLKREVEWMVVKGDESAPLSTRTLCCQIMDEP